MDPKIFMRLGDIYRKLDKTESALDEYENAAVAYAERGFIVKSIAVCKLILSIDSSRSEVESRLTGLYSEQNQQEKAPAEDEPSRREQVEMAPPPNILSLTETYPTPTERRNTPPVKEMVDFPLKVLEEAGVLSDVATSANETSLTRTPLFSDLSHEELSGIIPKLSFRFHAMGNHVYKKGNVGDSIYVITSGVAEETGYTKYDEKVKRATLMEGDFFGEEEYFSRSKRTSDIKAVTELELLEINRFELVELGKKYPHINEVLDNFYKERALDRVLSGSKIFRHLSPSERQTILKEVKVKNYKKGESVIKDGSKFDNMYLIIDGIAEVWKEDPSSSKRSIVKLGKGDYFGEVALLLATKRIANVSALTNLELMVFTRAHILNILSMHPVVRRVLETIARNHLATKDN